MKALRILGPLLLALVSMAHAQEMVRPESLPQGFVLVVDDGGDLATSAMPIFLASNTGRWNPGDPAAKLEERSDGRWQIVVPKPAEELRFEFKFTRGSWDTVEIAADLSDMGNRMLPEVVRPAGDERPIIELTVAKWADQRPGATARVVVDPYAPLNVTGDVRRLQVRGGAGGAERLARELLVWLPPGYDAPENAAVTYPVLYLLDGQNVFDVAPGTPAEWQADETAMRLIVESKIAPVVIVAIPHAGAGRMSEYLPVPAIDGVEPGADRFVEFLFDEVMPRVERAFRVRTDPPGRAIGGASLGAVASLHVVASRPGQFGGLIVESPSPLRPAREAWLGRLRAVERWPLRVFVGVSEHESGNAPERAEANARYVAEAREVADLIKPNRAARIRTETKVVVGAGQEHDERAWAARLPEALMHLFPAPRRDRD